MPYIVKEQNVKGFIQENNCNLNLVEVKLKYVPKTISKEDLSELCNNVYNGTLNINNKYSLYDYIDNVCEKYDIDLIYKIDIICHIMKKRIDL